MPFTFLKDDQNRIAEAALILEVGLQLEVIVGRQTNERNLLLFDQIIFTPLYGRHPQL
jgi:hypothetical protein